MLTNGCRQSNLRSAVIRVISIEVKPSPLLILKKVYGNKQIILMPLSSSLVTKYGSQLYETIFFSEPRGCSDICFCCVWVH